MKLGTKIAEIIFFLVKCNPSRKENNCKHNFNPENKII